MHQTTPAQSLEVFQCIKEASYNFRGGCEFVLKFSLASKQSVCTSVAERQMHRTVTMEQRRMH